MAPVSFHSPRVGFEEAVARNEVFIPITCAGLKFVTKAFNVLFS